MGSLNENSFTRTTAALLLILAVGGPLLYFFVDINAINYVHNSLSESFVDAVKTTRHFTDYIDVTCILLGIYALLKLHNTALFQKFIYPPLSSLLAGILTHLLKWPIGRWRPKALLRHDMFGFEFLGPIKVGLHKHFGVHSSFCDTYPFARTGILISFPSGHTSSMMAVMTAIAILQPKYRWLCFVIAALFGLTRVIESAHYPSDVLGGLVVGYIAAHWMRHMLIKRNWLPNDL